MQKIKLIFKKILKAGYCITHPLQNVIVFESVPDCADNTGAVFQEMVSRELFKKYKFVWRVRSDEAFPGYPNTEYLNVENPEDKKKFKKYLRRAKCLICCNTFLPSVRKKQLSLYLSHGTALKSVRSYYTVPTGINYFLAASPQVVELQSYEFNCPKDKIVPLGFPRNDVFSQHSSKVDNFFLGGYKKIILWYPTFRQHRNGLKTDAVHALPIIHEASAAERLNHVAAENEILIVIKPHFAQDLSYIKNLDLSNIRFIDDSFFAKHNITSYEFVNACDALITDYSSVYFDYTLCDKPVAAVWEDIVEYKKTPGLVANYEYLMKGAEKIFSLEDFAGFVRRVGEGEDLLKREREEIRDYANLSTDGKNSARVVDFILKQIENEA